MAKFNAAIGKMGCNFSSDANRLLFSLVLNVTEN